MQSWTISSPWWIAVSIAARIHQTMSVLSPLFPQPAESSTLVFVSILIPGCSGPGVGHSALHPLDRISQCVSPSPLFSPSIVSYCLSDSELANSPARLSGGVCPCPVLHVTSDEPTFSRIPVLALGPSVRIFSPVRLDIEMVGNVPTRPGHNF